MGLDDSSVGCLLKKVLVVDDETDIAEVVKQGLELQGIQVDAFNDPQKALEHFRPDTYDVVVLDVRMPRMNGFQLYREIMKRDDSTKVLFITAFEESPEEFRKAFPELDTHRFMKKPFTISKLKDRIMQGIGNQGSASRHPPRTHRLAKWFANRGSSCELGLELLPLPSRRCSLEGFCKALKPTNVIYVETR